MTEIKSCITCAHSVEHAYTGKICYCAKFAEEKIDYVTGKVERLYAYCEDMRKMRGKCKPEALGWEEKPPENEMTMMEVIKDFIKWLWYSS